MRPDPSLLANASPAQCISRWLDLMRTADKLLLAGIRRDLGPGGDANEAYRRWHADHMEEHHEAVKQMIQHLRTAEREQTNGR